MALHVYLNRASSLWIVMPDGTSFRDFGDCGSLTPCPPIGQIIDRDGRVLP